MGREEYSAVLVVNNLPYNRVVLIYHLFIQQTFWVPGSAATLGAEYHGYNANEINTCCKCSGRSFHIEDILERNWASGSMGKSRSKTAIFKILI